MAKIERALISVSDKSGIVEFAKDLSQFGISFLSTGGTSKILRDAGLAVTDVSEYTGFPEMMDGRVKTLHPKVHGGLLGVRSNAEHVATMKAHGILNIDMVVINLYPFQKTVAKPDCTFEDAIENIDIGGPAMLRSSAKNHESVTVIIDPAPQAPQRLPPDQRYLRSAPAPRWASPRQRCRLPAPAHNRRGIRQ